MVQFVNCNLFVDISHDKRGKPKKQSVAVIEFLLDNIKKINYNGLIVKVMPVVSKKDKKILVKNGLKVLPIIVFQEEEIAGANNIMDFLEKFCGMPQHKISEEEILRREQMKDMDIDKFERGEYDDNSYDSDDDLGADPEARAEDIRNKIAEYQRKRGDRAPGNFDDDEDGARRRPRGKQRRRRVATDDDDAPPTRGRRGRRPRPSGGGGGGGRRVARKPKSTDVNPEDWDPLTQQLLDKGGADLV